MDALRVFSLGIVAAMVVVAVRRWRARRAAGKQAPAPAPPGDPNQPTLPVERAFTDASTFGTAPNLQTIEVRRIGELVVATGRIGGCDPLVFPETSPYGRMVSPGEYPVETHAYHRVIVNEQNSAKGFHDILLVSMSETASV